MCFHFDCVSSLVGLAILTYDRDDSGKKSHSDIKLGWTQERKLGAPATADGGGSLPGLVLRSGGLDRWHPAWVGGHPDVLLLGRRTARA